MAITNNSRAVRGFNMKTGDAGDDGQVPHVVRHVAPGETADFTLADPLNPVYRAWSSEGHVDFSGALDVAPEPRRRRSEPPAA